MRHFFTAFCVLAAGITFASAQSVTTDPVGFVVPFTTMPNQINMLANSDTFVSVPFTRPPAFTGAVSSIAGNVITISGSPGWTTNQFVYAQGVQPNHYYVLIGPSATTDPKEGHSYAITANGASTLTVDTTHDDLTGIPASTQILVIPYWSVNTVFPASDAGVSFIVSPNALSRQTQILIPNYAGVGINLSAATTYFFSNGAWHTTADPSGDHGDDILLTYGYFIVRNASTGTTLTLLGGVLTKKETIPLFTRTAGSQDNFVSMTRPIDVSFNDSGLISSGAFIPSPNALSRTDQLLVFNNSATGINKSAATTYFYSSGAWHTTADTTGDHGTDLIKTGSGFIIRKAATADGATKYWVNAPTY